MGLGVPHTGGRAPSGVCKGSALWDRHSYAQGGNYEMAVRKGGHTPSVALVGSTHQLCLLHGGLACPGSGEQGLSLPMAARGCRR